MIEFGAFRCDTESRALFRGEEEVPLSPRVLAVLESLLKRPGKVVTKDAVLESAWEGAFVGEDSLSQAVSQIRSALDDDAQRPRYIQTAQWSLDWLLDLLARISQRDTKRAGARGREDKARAGSSAEAYSCSTPSTRIKRNAVNAGHCARAAVTR